MARDVWIPPAVEACVVRALSSSPHVRPQGADIFADELYNAMMATVDSSHIPIPLPRAPPPPRFLVVGAVLGGVLLLSGAAAGWWLYLRGDPPPSPAESGLEGEPPAAMPSTAPPTVPVVPPSEAKRRLMERTVARLEAELLRVAVLRGYGQTKVDTVMASYRDKMARAGSSITEPMRRAALADQILAWQAAPVTGDPSDRAQDVLEAVFLSMDGDLPLRERSTMLNELKNAAGDDEAASRRVRRRLVAWIEEHGGAYLRPEHEEIEIEDEQ
jgi:hypothetical protein